MYAILCFDRPGSAALRDQHRAAHVAFLDENKTKIVFGGPLKDVAAGASTGALIVVDCATHADADAFIHADPFFRAGVYENVAVRAFKQVFPQK